MVFFSNNLSVLHLLKIKGIKMIEIAKIAKHSILLISIFCFMRSKSMEVNNLHVREFASGIFNGKIESVQAAFSIGKKVNEKIYCPEIKIWIEPLLLAIKCLSKVKKNDSAGLNNRLDIIKLLLKKGAKIDKTAYQIIDLLKSSKAKVEAKKILDNHQVGEFIHIAVTQQEIEKGEESDLDETSFDELSNDDHKVNLEYQQIKLLVDVNNSPHILNLDVISEEY